MQPRSRLRNVVTTIYIGPQLITFLACLSFILMSLCGRSNHVTE